MLGNTGDELTNMWGLIATGVAVGGIGLTLSHRIWRGAFIVLGGAFIASGLLWAPIRQAAPTLGAAVTGVTSNPSNWFLVFILAVAALWLHQWRKELIAEARKPPQPDLRRDIEAQIAELNNRLNNRLVRLERNLDDPPTPPTPGLNWAPWRHRSHYTLYEFAKILAKTDPAAQSMNTEGSAYARLLQEDIEGKKLSYVPRFGYNEWDQRRYEKDIDYDTEISREDALAWADEKKFPIDHIR